MILISAVIILAISFIFAVKALKDLDVPEDVKKMIIKRKKQTSGVILFLQKKVVHYTSE